MNVILDVQKEKAGNVSRLYPHNNSKRYLVFKLEFFSNLKSLELFFFFLSEVLVVSVILAVGKSNVYGGPTSENKSQGVDLVWLGKYNIFPFPISYVLNHQILLIE